MMFAIIVGVGMLACFLFGFAVCLWLTRETKAERIALTDAPIALELHQ